ncbi:hypothetical protein C8P63_1491 [Melghirimyces profundicolus]|uniref:Uncharacterized protein n=1 Tax=Melghirimyces profundicolus TaxID=1242148 RepID=A0A2T6AVQ8_9BACL|nr:hypothetical protein [Melghirimyces profundicolus]PTX47836.1 hypothetical protein C8P63_1491 [Melghirimyces profundicolus]
MREMFLLARETGVAVTHNVAEFFRQLHRVGVLSETELKEAEAYIKGRPGSWDPQTATGE